MNIVIVGHVDHGKSTVIGRLLADTNSLPEGKLEAIKEKCKRESKTFEYAFLLDALKDEQSQGITIDAARCFFKTNKREYIIIDAPGHKEFLKNMVSGAARAEAAILVIDAHEGIQENSKRHGYLLSMLGINQVLVCVNKLDLVGYDKKIYDQVVADYTAFLKSINLTAQAFIPLSAVEGDNMTSLSAQTPWYTGKTLLSSLDTFSKESSQKEKPLRLPVQDVYKFTEDKTDSRRIIAGRITSGSLKVGDGIIFYPSRKRSTIRSIESFPHAKKVSAVAGESIGITLEEQLFVKRGDVLCKEGEQEINSTTTFQANIFWMGHSPLELQKDYKIKLLTENMNIRATSFLSILDSSKLSVSKKDKVERFDSAQVIFETYRNIAYDVVSKNKTSSRFVILDGYDVVGGGIITDSFSSKDQSKSSHVSWQNFKVQRSDRETLLRQKGALIWLTGLSGSGKSTIANGLQNLLLQENKLVYILDGDNIRHGLNKDLSFSQQDREENIRRVSEVAKLFVDSGVIVLANFIAPLSRQREQIKHILGDDYYQMYLDCPIEICEERDTKGLYKKARKGIIKDFTGIGSAYEVPEHPDLIIKSGEQSIEESVEQVYDFLKSKKLI